MKMFLDIEDFEDLFDSALLGAVMFGLELPNIPNLSGQIKNAGWSDIYEFSMSRIKVLIDRGFISKRATISPFPTRIAFLNSARNGDLVNTLVNRYTLSEKVQRAFDEGVVDTPSELFNPPEHKAIILRMYDITPTQVFD